jgi:hypothetical protein
MVIGASYVLAPNILPFSTEHPTFTHRIGTGCRMVQPPTVRRPFRPGQAVQNRPGPFRQPCPFPSSLLFPWLHVCVGVDLENRNDVIAERSRELGAIAVQVERMGALTAQLEAAKKVRSARQVSVLCLVLQRAHCHSMSPRHSLPVWTVQWTKYKQGFLIPTLFCLASIALQSGVRQQTQYPTRYH